MSYVYSTENIKQFSKDRTLKFTKDEKEFLLNIDKIKSNTRLADKLKADIVKLDKNDIQFLINTLKPAAELGDESVKQIIGSIMKKLHNYAKIIGISAVVIVSIAAIVTLCVMNPAAVAGAGKAIGKGIAGAGKGAWNGARAIGMKVGKTADKISGSAVGIGAKKVAKMTAPVVTVANTAMIASRAVNMTADAARTANQIINGEI